MKEIVKTLELSTAHITQSDNELLAVEKEMSIAYFEYGFFIFTPALEDMLHYSESMKKVVKYANENDCRFIILDRDAEQLDIDELNTNEW